MFLVAPVVFCAFFCQTKSIDGSLEGSVTQLKRLGLRDVDLDSEGKFVASITFAGERSMNNIANILRLCPKLRKVNFGGSSLSDSQFPDILVLKDLESIELSYTKVGDKSIKLLQAFSKLEYVGLDDVSFSDDTVSDLASIRSLKRLSMNCSRLSDHGAKLLLNSPVSRLELAYTAVGDSSMGAIAKMPNLEEIDLSGTRITDEGMTLLASCKRLRNLNVASTNITDDSIDSLLKIPCLESVNIRITYITDAGRNRIRKARPKLTAACATNVAQAVVQYSAC